MPKFPKNTNPAIKKSSGFKLKGWSGYQNTPMMDTGTPGKGGTKTTELQDLQADLERYRKLEEENPNVDYQTQILDLTAEIRSLHKE